MDSKNRSTGREGSTATGDIEVNASYLREKLRSGELTKEGLALLALFYADPAARVVQPGFHEEVAQLNEQIQETQKQEGKAAADSARRELRAELTALLDRPELDFGEVPEKLKPFFEQIYDHDHEARETLAHYEIVREGDVLPPSPAKALTTLAAHLRERPSRMEVIAEMEKPVLQLIPFFEPAGAGMRRIADALDTHPIPLQAPTSISPELQNRWQTETGESAKVIRWQVAVTEGVKSPSKEANPHRYEWLTEQYEHWDQETKMRGVTFADNISYAFLNAQELRHYEPEGQNRPYRAGLDPHIFHYSTTLLKDRTREKNPDMPVTQGNWLAFRVWFQEVRLIRDSDARFRPSVVVDVPNESAS